MKGRYLEDSEVVGRMLVAAGFLARRVEGKVILDLNCGRTPLFPFLPQTFGKYVGNTRDREAVAFLKRTYPEGVWLQCRDFDIPELVGVDVLLCLGWELGREEEEVIILDETVMGLVYRHYPEVVVLETWSRTPKLDDFNDLVAWVVDEGYREVGMWKVRPWQQSTGVMAQRGLVLLERSEEKRRKK